MRRDELLNWMPSIEAEFDRRGLDTYAMAVSKATEIIRRDGETIAALEAERDQLRAELAECRTVNKSLIVALRRYGTHAPAGMKCGLCEALGDALREGGE